MKKELKGSRESLSKFAPQILTIKIHTDKIRDVIGKGGAVIKGLAADTGATIDIDDDGLVKITCTTAESGEAALSRIKEITADVEVDQIESDAIDQNLTNIHVGVLFHHFYK